MLDKGGCILYEDVGASKNTYPNDASQIKQNSVGEFLQTADSAYGLI